MNDTVECPYCGKLVDLCHDDGHGREEGIAFEEQCPQCEKHFIFYTSIHFLHFGQKADCLNGGEHKYKDAGFWFYPARKKCEYCGRVIKGEINPSWKEGEK